MPRHFLEGRLSHVANRVVAGAARCSWLQLPCRSQGIGRHGAEWNNHPAPNVACADFGLVVDLEPGESREIPVYRNPVARLREVVPNDYYWVSILIRQGKNLRRLQAGGIEL
jgi:hypothetical protein